MSTAVAERSGIAFGEDGRSRDKFFSDFGFSTRMVTEKGSGVREVSRSEVSKALEGMDSLPQGASDPKSGDLILDGYASTWVEDRDFEFILRTAYDKTLEDYLKLNPILLYQHDHGQPFGQTMKGEADDFGLAVRSYVRKPEEGEERWKLSAYNDVRAGIVRTKSVGGFFWREIIDGEIAVTEIDLFEISVVSVPSNPLSIFEAARKSVIGDSMRSTFAMEGREQMLQLLGAEPLTSAALVRLDDGDRLTKYLELSMLFTKSTGTKAPDFDSFRNITKKIESGKADPAELLDETTEIIKTLSAPKKFAKDDGSQKAGRVLSKRNETKIKGVAESMEEAITELRGILESLPDEGEAGSSGEVKGAFFDAMQGCEIQDSFYEGWWILREAVWAVLDPDGDYRINLPVNVAAIRATLEEFADWFEGVCQAENAESGIDDEIGEDGATDAVEKRFQKELIALTKLTDRAEATALAMAETVKPETLEIAA